MIGVRFHRREGETMTERATVLDPLMSDAQADAMVRLCEDFGSYRLYATEKSESTFASELAQRYDAAANYVRSGGRFGRQEPPKTLALRTNYFRESYAYGDERMADGIETFLFHEALLDAARRLYDRPVIEPAIAYANLLLPGQELAVHTDVPEFRGANRKLFPQWLMVVMHHSGLFEQWRMPIATGVTYFAKDGVAAPGGELAYYPDGPEGDVAVLEARHNTGIVLDTDSVFHGVDRVGLPGAEPPELQPDNVLAFDPATERWSLRPERGSTTQLVDYGWDEVRFSVSWKAYCFADDDERVAWHTHADDLEFAFILDRLRGDLDDRDVLARDADISEKDLALLLIRTYEHYPEPASAG
jgi:hypothetical protein